MLLYTQFIYVMIVDRSSKW